MAKLICDNVEDSRLYQLGERNKEIKEEYIVINPNASDLRLERRWSRTKFIELIKLIN